MQRKTPIPLVWMVSQVASQSNSYSNGAIVTEPIFDHEKRDVYRLPIAYAPASYEIVMALGGANRQMRDQWLRAAPSIPLNILPG